MKLPLALLFVFACPPTFAAFAASEELTQAKLEYQKLTQLNREKGHNNGLMNESSGEILEVLAGRIATLEDAENIESKERLFPNIEPWDVATSSASALSLYAGPDRQRSNGREFTRVVEHSAPQKYQALGLVKLVSSQPGQGVFQIVAREKGGRLIVRKDALTTRQHSYWEFEVGRYIDASIFNPKTGVFGSRIVSLFSDGTIAIASSKWVMVNGSSMGYELRILEPDSVTFFKSPAGRLVGIVKPTSPTCRAFKT